MLDNTSICGSFSQLLVVSTKSSVRGDFVGGRKAKSLVLLIEPRRGLTQELLGHTGAADSRLVLFGGPHGISAPVDEYESVLMIASGSGITAHLPYLKQLIHSYSARKVRARRIHLVWQLPDIGESQND